MNITDIFIRRPVIAVSISLIILLSGIWGMNNLPLSLYPQVTVPLVHVNTAFPGASPEVVQNYVTAQLQAALNSIDGVDYVTSESAQNDSNIALHFQLGEDLDKAIATVMRKIQAVSSQLPAGTFAPTISGGEGNNFYFLLQATTTAPKLEWMTDYLDRMIVPQLELLNGASDVSVWGPTYTMDISLDPHRLIAHNISALDVISALQKYNTPAAPGKTYGNNVSYALNPETTLRTEADFDNLLVKNDGVHSIYLKDVGKAIFQGNTESLRAYFDGARGDAIPISVNANSNPLIVGKELKQMLPKLQSHLPQNIKLGMTFDITTFISASLHEVIKAIAESLFIVVIVMLLLIGSPRAVVIPLSAIPLSLIGVCFIMLMCHFSFNTLTLLAMVIAIGLVVDDAIVVVENIVRHIENGKSGLEAAIIGAREITGPVIAMTLTLAAVYAPMLMASGITGHLFTEFAMTLAGSVLISGVVALTLSPFLCSRLINQASLTAPRALRAESRVNFIRKFYLAKLHSTLSTPKRVLVLWMGILVSCVGMYISTPHELVPDEDTGIIQLFARAPSDVNLNFLEKQRPAIEEIIGNNGDIVRYVEVLRENALFSYITLKDWSKRKMGSAGIQALLQKDLNNIAALQPFVKNISLLPGNDSSSSINMVLVGNVDYPTLYAAAKKLEQDAQQSGRFLYLYDDLEYSQPQIDLKINPAAAMAMNVTPIGIASQLTGLLSQGRIQQFAWQGHSYNVQISIPAEFRRNPEDIANLQIPNQEGHSIPLNSVVDMRTSVVPQSLNQFQKMNSVTITAVPSPHTSFSDALTSLRTYADTKLDKKILLDYSGMTRQFMQEGQRTLWVFGMAVLVIFLVLSIQFNRFQDALIILLGSVPLAIFGALLPLYLNLGTINIYTQIGLLTLIGLISKHGILLTEFANHAQINDHKSPREAIIEAAKLRFRPILMTTAAMVVGALPLVFASGAGAESRSAIGIVVVFGLTLGTILTLFVMPVLYLQFGRKA